MKTLQPYDYPIKYTANWSEKIRWQGPGLYRFNGLWVEWWKADDAELTWYLLHPTERTGPYRCFTNGMVSENSVHCAALHIDLHNPKFNYFTRFYDCDGCCYLHGNSWLNPELCDCHANWQRIVDNMTPYTPAEIEQIRHNWNVLGIAY